MTVIAASCAITTRVRVLWIGLQRTTAIENVGRDHFGVATAQT